MVLAIHTMFVQTIFGLLRLWLSTYRSVCLTQTTSISNSGQNCSLEPNQTEQNNPVNIWHWKLSFRFITKTFNPKKEKMITRELIPHKEVFFIIYLREINRYEKLSKQAVRVNLTQSTFLHAIDCRDYLQHKYVNRYESRTIVFIEPSLIYHVKPC